MKKDLNTILSVFVKILLGIAILGISYVIGILLSLFTYSINIHPSLQFLTYFITPALLFPLLFPKIRKKLYYFSFLYTTILLVIIGIHVGNNYYKKSLIIKTDVNIKIEDYLPFTTGSKIVKLEKRASLSLKDNLPILDGAAAVFPVYSAFIQAVYPNTVTLYTPPFLYNNTVNGYRWLANKQSDLFFGAYPSPDQIEYASSLETEFEYTKIASEGFVFFVNKNNPIDHLTTEQIKKIYSGEITNWKEVGGKNEKIIAYQRNEGSGSQSMLKRFMGKTTLMDAPTTQINDFMDGIIEQVADYSNSTNAIGFSFHYYLENIIANPNVKMIKVDGIAPTLETISNETYPITTPLYAVTYKGNTNPNVQKLLNWILSEEGQDIIEKTGYAKLHPYNP